MPTSRSLVWLLLCPLVAALAAAASASFLWALHLATQARDAAPWLYGALPLLGLLIGWLYERGGAGLGPGTNLVLGEIYEPKTPLPGRLAPLVWITSVLSHVGGASTGREGAAVQMGAALADRLSGPFRRLASERPALLMAGASAGFASAFGTPLAGALFGIEVARGAPGRRHVLLPCLASAFLADRIAQWLHVPHTPYPRLEGLGFGWGLLGAVLGLGAAAGLAARGFARGTEHLALGISKAIPRAPLRPAAVGALLGLLFLLIPGATRYAGLSLPALGEAFEGRAWGGDWILKLGLTALSLAGGFKGGEAMPLFFVGATLGSWLSPWLGLGAAPAAALGFAACFGAASRTPLACALLAGELFGWPLLPWSLLCGAAAWRMMGRRGIYSAQK